MKSYNLSENCCLSCKDETTLNLAITNTLPLEIEGKPKFVFIIVNNTTELDVSAWLPSGLCAGSVVRLQKGLKNPYKIIFDDGNVNYQFVNKKGEIITLVYTQQNKFEII